MLKFLPAAFFAFMLVIGIFLFDDYGISWDEPVQRELGNANWSYVLHGDDSLFNLINKYHGPFIEMIESVPEKIFQLQDKQTIFLSRHLLNYIIFWIGPVFLFLLGKEVFRNRWYALLAVMILYLTPRIFAQSFYNSKDIPLLSFFIISNYFLIRFLNRPSYVLAAVFAIVSGMLFGIRIPGIIIPVFTILFFVLNLLNRNLSKESLKYLFTYLFLFILFAVVFYPVSWSNPVGTLQKAFSIMSHFPYDDPQFFMGKLVKPQELPWYYIPVWMGITIPILWQLLFFAGLISLLIMIIRNAKEFWKTSWQWLLIGGWCFFPWLIVLFLHSPVYDEWRHLFFIYPAFVLIAVAGVRMLLKQLKSIQSKFTRVVLLISYIVLLIIQSFSLLKFMITNHPYENVYFNFLAGKNPQLKFDLDYWGLSYRQGLEYLVRHEKEDTIKVCWHNAGGNYNLIWLSNADRERIREVPFDSSEYFLTNFRFHPEQYVDSAWHRIRVDGFTILSIVKLH